MHQSLGRQQFSLIKSLDKAFRVHVIAITVVACAFSSGYVQAQSSKFGTYSGTINVSTTAINSRVSYSASGKVSLPVTRRDSSSAHADFLADAAPDATFLISKWDEYHKELSAGSDGKFSSWKCSLAAPVEILMTVTGVLDVDLKAKTHALSLILGSRKDVAFNCMHSHSGAYKKEMGVGLYIGTGYPGEHYDKQLPFSDAAHLTAKYTLIPNTDNKGTAGPLIQEWNLRLTR